MGSHRYFDRYYDGPRQHHGQGTRPDVVDRNNIEEDLVVQLHEECPVAGDIEHLDLCSLLLVGKKILCTGLDDKTAEAAKVQVVACSVPVPVYECGGGSSSACRNIARLGSRQTQHESTGPPVKSCARRFASV
jgi:hypothetical protein